MEGLLIWMGRVAGAGGTVLLIVAMGLRMTGQYMVGGFQVGTLLQASIAVMVLGCLCYVASQAEARRER